MNNTKGLIFSFVLILAMMATGYLLISKVPTEESNQAPVDTSDWITYKNSEFELRYPNDLEVQYSEDKIISFISMDDPTRHRIFLNLRSKEGPENFTLYLYMNDSGSGDEPLWQPAMLNTKVSTIEIAGVLVKRQFLETAQITTREFNHIDYFGLVHGHNKFEIEVMGREAERADSILSTLKFTK